jgi:peptidoglycan/LPS O-acetylase OafA/YrhL
MWSLSGNFLLALQGQFFLFVAVLVAVFLEASLVTMVVERRRNQPMRRRTSGGS